MPKRLGMITLNDGAFRAKVRNMPEQDDRPRLDNSEEVRPMDLSQLVIGPPFAMAGDCEFLDASEDTGIDGSIACIKCECGHAFKLNLLSARPKVCPGCKATYTHALLVCRTDDVDMFDDAVVQVMHANGIEPPNDEASSDATCEHGKRDDEPCPECDQVEEHPDET